METLEMVYYSKTKGDELSKYAGKTIRRISLEHTEYDGHHMVIEFEDGDSLKVLPSQRGHEDVLWVQGHLTETTEKTFQCSSPRPEVF